MQKKDERLRHYGFHEMDTIKAFLPVTKYVTELRKAEDARYEIEKCIHIAKSGRPGPVVLVMPDDITWLEINPEEQRAYEPQSEIVGCGDNEIGFVLSRFSLSKRPVIIFGKGVNCAGARENAKKLIEQLDCPVALTWAVKDLINGNDIHNIGSFGIQGTRAANFAVQKADFVLAVGTRLDPSEIGAPASRFAENAYLISVDLDLAELDKYRDFNIHCDRMIRSDAGIFLQKLSERILSESNNWGYNDWLDQINIWKNKYPQYRDEYHDIKDVHPYVVVETLNKLSHETDTIVTDCSTSRNFVFQSFEMKKDQRIHSWHNFSCLGYGLPAAIGAAYARNSTVIAIMGDGALQFNIQELATVAFNKLNIKIFVFDNGGYANIIRLQNKCLGGRHYGSDRENGLPIPNSAKIASAYGLPVYEIRTNDEVEEKIQQMLETEGPAFCSVYLDINWWTIPFRNGRDPLEDMTPKLDRDEFEEIMKNLEEN